MKKIIILYSIILSIPLYGQKAPNVLILDDAEKPKMSRWKVEGPVSSDIGVDYISSEKERKRVIRLRGVELNNVFTFRGNKGQDLDISGFKILEWKMKFTKPFVVKVDVLTSDGIKYLLYSDMTENNKTDDQYLHLGLGSRYRDGKWRTVIRDLGADIASLLPNVKLKSIKAISFRGSGYLDDIWVLDAMPKEIVLENGENNLRGWDRIGKGGSLSIDFDTVLGEIVKFDSGPKGVVFRLRKPDRSYWNIKTNVLLQWKLRTTADATIYVVGNSSVGKYTIAYTFGEKAPYRDKTSGIIYYGLGAFVKDGVWHVFNRDLSDDIRRVVPGADILSVGSVLLKGTGYIDDIRLLAQPPMESDALKGWEVYDSEPSGALVSVVNDIEKGDVVELSGAGIKNGYRYHMPVPANGKEETRLTWDMWFSEPFDIMLAVDTGGLVRYVHYVSMDEKHEKIKDGELYIGIGETKTDGKWYTISRNVLDDIKKLGSDVDYLSTNYFMVRGSGKIGKIVLSKEELNNKQNVGPSATASVALGQYDLYRGLKNIWDLDKGYFNSLYHPEDVIADRSGGIYVADTANNRIMYWEQRPSRSGTDVSTEFNYDGKLKSPKAVALIDGDKYIVVADSGNNRILIFKTPLDETSKPERILSGLKNPSGLFFDGQRLIVADTGNSRVLVWNSMPKSDDTPFDLVLGQSRVTDGSPNKGGKAPSYNTMMYPASVYSDGKTLYVADTGNNRVLVFDKIPTMNGWHADAVVGQDKFKFGLANKGGKVSGDTLNSPKSIFINNGLMFIADAGNNRIVVLSREEEVWAPIGVMGQINYSSSGVNEPLMTPTPGTLYSPSKIVIRDGIIYVADTLNNRVLIY